MKQAEQSKFRTVGIYAGALGFGYNTELLAKRKLPEPKCWSDLLSEKYKDEVQVADPNSSGTSYTMLATMVQIYGEDKGFDYLKRLHRNINQYTKSGAAPAKATASGETLIGITFQHDLVTFASQGNADQGRGAVRGHRLRGRLDEHHQGRQEPEGGEDLVRLGADRGSAVDRRRGEGVPGAVEPHAKVPPQAPRLEPIKLIDYDFAKYGSSAERKRLLSKWDKEVKALPQVIGSPPRQRACAAAVVRGRRAPGERRRSCTPSRASLGWAAAIPAAHRRARRASVAHGGRGQAGKLLVAVGVAGLLLLLAQGFLFRHRTSDPPAGWPTQPGWATAPCSPRRLPDAFLPGAGAAGCRGDSFVVGAIGLVIATIAAFVFFPIFVMLESAFETRASFGRRASSTARSGASTASTRACAAAWRGTRVILALLVGAGSTLLGLAFALIAARTAFRYKGRAAGDERAADHHAAVRHRPRRDPALRARRRSVGAALRLVRHPALALDLRPPGVALAQLLAFTPIAFLVLLGVVQGISPFARGGVADPARARLDLRSAR